MDPKNCQHSTELSEIGCVVDGQCLLDNQKCCPDNCDIKRCVNATEDITPEMEV